MDLGLTWPCAKITAEIIEAFGSVTCAENLAVASNPASTAEPGTMILPPYNGNLTI